VTILTDRLWLLGRWPRVAALLALGLVIALGMAPLDWWFGQHGRSCGADQKIAMTALFGWGLDPRPARL